MLLNRRVNKLDIKINEHIGNDIVIALDSTGIKVANRGEWMRHKWHGANKSRWGTVGLGVVAIMFGSIAVAAPVSTAVFVIFMSGFGLLFLGISHVVYGIGSSQSPGWARGFSIGAGALAIAISFLVMASPFAGAVFVSIFLGIALIIIGIEIIAVGVTGRRMQTIPHMGT